MREVLETACSAPLTLEKHAIAPFPPLLALADWDLLRRRFHLTPRESEVAWWVCRGLNDGQVCAQLAIRRPTVRTILGRVFSKAGCAGRVDLILTLVHAAGAIHARRDDAVYVIQ